VLGARSNFGGGPSTLAAALTGLTPRYGYHLEARRRATRRFRLTALPREPSEWGAAGGLVGEACGSYWQVPVIEGLDAAPGSDALKHFGAALASFGSVALFHMPDITAKETEFAGPPPAPVTIGSGDIAAFMARYAAPATSSTSSSLPPRSSRCSRSPRWPTPSTAAGCIPIGP
jgi:predicted aconitase